MQTAPPLDPDLALAPAPAEPRLELQARPLLRQAWEGAWTLALGGLGLLVGLAALAAVPVLQFATLGWLLEAEGRLARGEGLRGALPGLRRAVPWGAACLGCGLLALPLLILASYAADAQLLAPGSAQAVNLTRASLGYGVLAFGHAALALAAGRGRLLNFARPLHNLRLLWTRRRDPEASLWRELREHALALRLPHYLRLGWFGFLVGAAWLGPPTLLLSLKRPLLSVVGALGLVCLLRPALVAQARVAREGRLRAGFELGALRDDLRRAPLSIALALTLSLALALPLYLLKVELLPRDALWLPALVFLVALWPGRIAAGWAQRRAARPGRAPWPLRLLGLAIALPSSGAYVFFVFFSQYFGWRGAAGLFAHHAYLLPVAFY